MSWRACSLAVATIGIFLIADAAKHQGYSHLSAPAAYTPYKPVASPAAPLAQRDVPAAGFTKTSYRSDVFEISLRSPDAGPGGYETEYKLHMNEGDALAYSWSVEGLKTPDEFFFDFHGEVESESGKPPVPPATYRRDIGDSQSGYLVAPFTGAHGWYFQNQSGLPVVVHLKVSGFYELIYPGEFGNESGIVPRK